MDIHHFGHGHKLVLKDIKNWQNAPCSACGFRIIGSAYRCSECHKFIIHKSCAELPREVKSHFHPQHTLTLLAEPPYKDGEFKCVACEKMSRGFTFHCSECEYDLDVHCAGLIIPTKQHLISHPHPLVLYDKNKEFDIFCSCCEIPIINGLIYVCLECKVKLDVSCAQLPQKIQHRFHLEHPLTVLSRAPSNQHICNVCGNYASGFLFRCSECDFDLDVRCASLIPTTNKNDEHHDEEQVSHRHLLIHCDKTKNLLLHVSCYGCSLPFEEEDDSVYFSLDCKKLLHKSCAHLPHEMEHPFHLPHTLSLVENKLSIGQRTGFCGACMYILQGFIYWCRVCCVCFHVKCLFPLPPLINLELHKHPLAFLNSEKYIMGRFCYICKMECCIPILCCMSCNFSVHLQCVSELPPTVKHKCHLHSLTLTRSPIKDHDDEDDDAEFYCDACEEHRKLSETTCYCAECHYVAHVRCVISEVWPHMQRVSLALGDKLGKMKLADCDQVNTRADDSVEKEATKELRNVHKVGDPVLDEIDEDIALVHTTVDRLKALKRKITRRLEMETMKLDQLKKRRDQHILSLQQ